MHTTAASSQRERNQMIVDQDAIADGVIQQQQSQALCCVSSNNNKSKHSAAFGGACMLRLAKQSQLQSCWSMSPSSAQGRIDIVSDVISCLSVIYISQLSTSCDHVFASASLLGQLQFITTSRSPLK